MNMLQLERMKNDNGFIAALDQSGGSTPKASAVRKITLVAWPAADIGLTMLSIWYSG